MTVTVWVTEALGALEGVAGMPEGVTGEFAEGPEPEVIAVIDPVTFDPEAALECVLASSTGFVIPAVGAQVLVDEIVLIDPGTQTVCRNRIRGSNLHVHLRLHLHLRCTGANIVSVPADDHAVDDGGMGGCGRTEEPGQGFGGRFADDGGQDSEAGRMTRNDGSRGR